MTFFESDDEKWMMGDFDLDLDVDLGRPIDFEADESVTNQDDSGFQDANSSGNAGPRKGTSSVSGPAASASVQRSSAPHNNDVDNTRLDSSANGNHNSVQRSGGSSLVNSNSMGVNPDGNGNNRNGNKEVSFQPLPNVRSSGNGNGNNGNGGKTNLSSSTSSVQPSAGGFSFPPSIVRVYLAFFLFTQNNNHNQNQSGIGSKRPAESMLQHPQQQ